VALRAASTLVANPDIDLAQGITNLDWVSVSALSGYVAPFTINGRRAKVFTNLVADWSTHSGTSTWAWTRRGRIAPRGGCATGYPRRLADGATPLTGVIV
jgi:hypothetical protein